MQWKSYLHGNRSFQCMGQTCDAACYIKKRLSEIEEINQNCNIYSTFHSVLADPPTANPLKQNLNLFSTGIVPNLKSTGNERQSANAK